MSTATAPFRIPKPVRHKVGMLRWLVRAYVCWNGLAATAIAMACAFWIGLAIDWTFEPSPGIRTIIWLLAAMISALVAYRYLLSPIFVPLTNTNLALLLERNFPDLKQSVITTIEAADNRRSSSTGDDKLLQHTGRTATETLSGKKLLGIFQLKPLLRKTAIAVALITSIVAFASMQSEAFGFWLQRIQLSEQAWPRDVSLSILGFKEIDGRPTVNVARDDDYDLQALASILDGHVAPDQIEIRYRQSDGRRGRFPLTRIGSAVPGRDESQLFRYEFKKVAEDLDFDLIGGDDRLRNLRLRVVERPQIVRIWVECEFPEYLNRKPQTIPVSGRIELPEGTKVRCRLEANKPLVSAIAHDPAQQNDFDTVLNSDNNREFSLLLNIEQEDRVLLVTMHDHDGVENREPYRIVLSSVLDQPPEVSVQLREIGSAVTPQARIPFIGSATDEYGLQKVWFEHQTGKQTPEMRALPAQPNGRREITEFDSFDLAITDPVTNRKLVELKPGQQLSISLKASDNYDLNQQTHTGSSQRFLLDVVTASELRSLLEKKELALRQRFESIYEKMTGTRELLDRISLENGAAKDTSIDQPESERIQERDRLRVTGALQNVVQLSYETLGVADGIEGIVGELTNNRVDSEELTERLLRGIAEPLREIGGVSMPQFERSLQRLQTSFSNEPQSHERSLVEAKTQGDAVLIAMKNVLDRMLELESYNELVELLRGIVSDQEQIQDETKLKRKQKLRSLLED